MAMQIPETAEEMWREVQRTRKWAPKTFLHEVLEIVDEAPTHEEYQAMLLSVRDWAPRLREMPLGVQEDTYNVMNSVVTAYDELMKKFDRLRFVLRTPMDAREIRRELARREEFEG